MHLPPEPSDEVYQWRYASLTLLSRTKFLKYPDSILNDAEKRVTVHKRYTELPETPGNIVTEIPKKNILAFDHYDNDYYDALENIDDMDP